MSELIIFACNDEGGAQALETRLVSWQGRKGVRLLDAALVRRKLDGGSHVEHAARLVGAGQLGGIFWGMLIGALFWAKWWGLSIGGAVGEIGLDDDFVRQAGDAISRGQSGLLLLVQDELANEVIGEGRLAGARVVQATLSPQAERRLASVFGRAEKQV